MSEVILILLAVLAGVFTQRVVGFGMPIIVFPITLIFFLQTSALIIALLVGILSSLIIIYELRRKTQVDFNIIKTITPVSIIGIIVGAYILSVINKETLQIFLGLAIVISLNIQRYFLPKPKEKLKINRKLQFYGLLAGFFNSTVALSAGPLLVWVRSFIVKSNQVRVLMAYYFFTMNFITILFIQIFESRSLVDIPVYLLALLVPTILLANYLGSITSNKIDEALYSQLAYFALMFAGIITFAAGIKGYL